MPEAQAARNCHATMMGLLPAVVEQDFATFSQAIAEVQAIVGDYFAHVQTAGRYTSPRVRRAVEHVQRVCGVTGVGQSSWGPPAFVFADSQIVAEALVKELESRFGDEAGLAFMISAARNCGATITHSDQALQPRIALA